MFGSARRALRTAAELQRRFVALTAEDTALPLRVGIGLDAGEAVAVGEGFRGGALNLAARLCSLARPGEVLISDGVVHLVGKVDGFEFIDRGRVAVKGMKQPVHVVQAAFGLASPPEEEQPQRRRRTIVLRLAAVLGLVIAGGIVGTFIIFRGSSGAAARIGANAVGELDPGNARLVTEVPVGNGPSGIAAGPNSLWVSNAVDGTVSRLDPTGARPGTTIQVGGDPEAIAVGEGAVWVAKASARTIAQINPDSNTVVRTIAVGNGPTAIAVGAGAVWVANTIDGTVSRVNPRLGQETQVIAVGGQLGDIIISGDSVWVSRRDPGSVVRIETRSGQIVKSIAVGNGAEGLAAAEGAVWVANENDSTVSKIDPTTNSVTSAVKVGDGPTVLVAAGGALWAANRLAGTLSRIDLQAGDVTKTVDLGNTPSAAVSTGNRIWVTALVPLAAHRGGTLRVTVPNSFCRCLDPMILADPNRWRIAIPLYDGLVGFRRVGGAAGNTLVPDLATNLPTPTDRGRTYTFQLRRGIRFSNGNMVHGRDFRASIERLIHVNQVTRPPYYDGIVGAKACEARPARACDLTKGIAVDDATSTIKIRLTAPDPDFLYKLALMYAFVVPAGSRPHQRPIATGPQVAAIGSYVLPGTGPYRVARFVPAREIRLVRNPYFHEWSKDAQPDGYPDVIAVRESGTDLSAMVKTVEHGQADWVTNLTSADVRRFALRRPAQLHISPTPGTTFMFLNTRVPPFTDRRVRQALNYAVDRRRVVQIDGGLGTDVTCQLLPPSFTGYRPYCPYTRVPAATIWTAPDLAKARALVARSGTRGKRVRVLVGPDRAQLGPYFVSLLRQLGYRAELRPSDSYFEDAADPRKRAQIGELTWFEDFPGPANFFAPIFSCAAYTPKQPATNSNISEFCDQSLDRKAAQAAALQLTDPIAAADAWAKVDRALVNSAPLVPLYTPVRADFVSRRVGNYQYNGQFGALLDQLWLH